MANHYEVPSWAGKPPVGLHLDVLKGEKLIQKLMIDEKRCYLFGRNSQMNDFCIDHASCSRVHSALVYHKHLNRAFLVDLGSTHGTYIGNMRLESNKPTQLPIDSTFHFGASTRNYIIRERPQAGIRPIIDEIEKAGEEAEGGLLGLPETETELDNLTEFNTAHNRRISMLGISDDPTAEKRNSANKKRKRRGVSFNEDDEIINPEDIDPSVGRFRNLVQTTVLPTSNNKRQRVQDVTGIGGHAEFKMPKTIRNTLPELYQDLPPETNSNSSGNSTTTDPTSMAIPGGMFSSALGSRLGIMLPNPAPEVDLSANIGAANIISHLPDYHADHIAQALGGVADVSHEPKKKKYAKEAWPGKKPAPALLV